MAQFKAPNLTPRLNELEETITTTTNDILSKISAETIRAVAVEQQLGTGVTNLNTATNSLNLEMVDFATSTQSLNTAVATLNTATNSINSGKLSADGTIAMTGNLNMGRIYSITNTESVYASNVYATSIYASNVYATNVWLPVNGRVYFGTSTNYIEDQNGTNFLFMCGTNWANFSWE